MNNIATFTAGKLVSLATESLFEIDLHFSAPIPESDWPRQLFRLVEGVGRVVDTDTLAKVEARLNDSGNVEGVILLIWSAKNPLTLSGEFALLDNPALGRFSPLCLARFFSFATSVRRVFEIHGLKLVEGLAVTGQPSLVHLYSHLAFEQLDASQVMDERWKKHMMVYVDALISAQVEGSAPPAAAAAAAPCLMVDAVSTTDEANEAEAEALAAIDTAEASYDTMRVRP